MLLQQIIIVHRISIAYLNLPCVDDDDDDYGVCCLSEQLELATINSTTQHKTQQAGEQREKHLKK